MPTPPESLQPPNDRHVPWLLHRIWKRVNVKNEHFMGAIVGQEGSGKSHTAIKIASEIDPTFTHERVIFDVGKLLKALKEGNHEPGHFWVLDEAGVQLGRRTWQERSQVLTNQALQLIRNHNLGLLFTLPRLGELDSQAQGRLQAFLELTEKENGEFVRGKWKFLDPDRTDTTGKIYKKYPRRRVDGRVVRVRSVAFTPPDPEIVDPYEQRKTEFQDAFYEKVLDELEDGDGSDDGDGESESMGPKEVAQDILGNGVENYISEHPQNGSMYVDKELIGVDYDLSIRDAKKVKKLVQREFDPNDLKAEA